MSERIRTRETPATWRDVPRSVWTLGFVSMFMDVSSEMIHAALPLYLVSAFGASALVVGVIEGVAEATAAFVKVFSGALSDFFGRRKALAALGYGLAAVTKPIFPLAPSLGWIVGARFLDRVGKGIRGAPRDALIADITPADQRGASFGLRQALDTIGAVAGPLAAMIALAATANNFPVVFWIAVLPAFLSFALIAFVVKEPAGAARRSGRFPLNRAEIARLPRVYWLVVAIASALTLARFSEAFLILDAQHVGLPAYLAPAALVLMNVVYAAAAFPAGASSDRDHGRRPVLLLGVALLVAADLVLASSASVWGAAIGVALWGLHMAFTQGLLSALVADNAPEDLRGTAFGVFNVATGFALLAASLIAGGLWDAIGPKATFLAGAGFAAASLAGLAWATRKAPPRR